MEVHFAPELQAKIDGLVKDSGCPVEELIENAMEAYIADLVQAREMLDSRYDDLKSGRVKPISRDEMIAHFREKSAAARRNCPVQDRVWYPEARLHVDEAWEFIGDDNLAAADRLIGEIFAAIRALVPRVMAAILRRREFQVARCRGIC
jgi:hypothetical protein